MAKRDLDLIPLFWRNADDGVTKVLEAVESSLDDLFLDIDTRYNALKIETCDDFKPELMRPMYLYKLVTDKGKFNYALWNTLRNYQKNFFVDRYFIVPETGVSGTYTGRWLVTQEIRDAETLYCGKFIANGEGFFVDRADVSTPKNTVIFDEDPFITFSGYWKDTEITTPWRKTYPCEMLTLWASDLKMSESVIDTHYADLVMDETFQKQFRSTGAYSAFIYNFYKVLYQGATVQGLCGFVNSISGYDYIKSDSETVERFEFVYDPDSESTPLQRIIYTDKNKYVLPIDVPVAHWVQLGAVLPKFTPITELIQVHTYLEDPEWIFNDEYGKVDNLIAYHQYGHDSLKHYFDFSAKVWPPRFDMCRPIEAAWKRPGIEGMSEFFDKGMQSLEEGLWHNIVGPNFVLIDFLDYETYNTYGDAFDHLLRELIPVHVYCDVTYRWGGWFFYDEEVEAWFGDEDRYFIEDPEGGLEYSISAVPVEVPYQGIVRLFGKAPATVQTAVYLSYPGSEGEFMPQPWDTTSGQSNPFFAQENGTWELEFRVDETYSPYIADLKVRAVGIESNESSTFIRIIPHYLSFSPLPFAIALDNQPYTITGYTDAPADEDHVVTVSWPKYPGTLSPERETAVCNLVESGSRRTFSLTRQFPAGVYNIRATVTHGTIAKGATGDARFINQPAEIEIKVFRTDIIVNEGDVYPSGGVRNDPDIVYAIQQVPDDPIPYDRNFDNQSWDTVTAVRDDVHISFDPEEVPEYEVINVTVPVTEVGGSSVVRNDVEFNFDIEEVNTNA